MHQSYDREKDTINAITVLLEFYSKDMLNRFYHVCQDYESDISEAFVMLKEITVAYLAVEGDFPDFLELAKMYAQNHGFNPDDFTKSFFVPDTKS